ncbi:DNA (cytosine-5-)-methyltransferase [Halobacteriaceae archaeon GCM10025711]
MDLAGFQVVAAVDTNTDALATHRANLPGHALYQNLAFPAAGLPPAVRMLAGEIDLLHGSPPCQDFSNAKGDRDPDADRNQLVWRFVEWVDRLQPRAATMENVPGMATITPGFMDRVVAAFSSIGYRAKWRTLNAADYGVPQTRRRIFVVAVRNDQPLPSPWFPPTTHAETATSTLGGRRLKEWRTVRDAIGDLATLPPGCELTSQQSEGHQKAGRRPLHTVEEPARTVRTGTLPELHPDGFPSHDPEPLTNAAKQYLTGDARHLEKHPPNEPDAPARTVPANISRGVPYGLVRVPQPAATDGGRTSESRQPDVSDIRRLTVREAARLQSFPDWFVFKGVKPLNSAKSEMRFPHVSSITSPAIYGIPSSKRVVRVSHVETAPHELEANLLYPDHGLRPYWLLSHIVVNQFDGSHEFDVELPTEEGGEEWHIEVRYQKGGIAPRPTDPIDAERLYEWRINAYGRGQRKAAFLFRPRFPGMYHYETGNEISTPFIHVEEDEAVNVKIDGGSNLEPREYTDLLPQVCQAAADEANTNWSPAFFADQPHDISRIVQHERYVRVTRSMGNKVVRSGGIFQRLFHLFATEKGSKFVYSADNTEAVGYNHQLRIPRQFANTLVQGHKVAKQFKHYYPKHPEKFSEDDALYHPKIGVLFRKGLNDSRTIPWNEHHRLTKELEEALINLLTWGDVPTRAGPTFVADDHFDNVASDRDVGFFEDPTPEMEASQEAVLVRVMRDLNDTDVDVLESLVTDGGKHVGDLADEHGRTPRTIYRVLEHLNGLVESDNGNVRWVSQKLKEDVHEVITAFERDVENRARTVAHLLDLDERTLERAGSSLQRWLEKYAVKLIENPENDKLRVKIESKLTRLKSIQSKPMLADVLEEGYDAWKDAGRDAQAFGNALLHARVDGSTKRGRVKDALPWGSSAR